MEGKAKNGGERTPTGRPGGRSVFEALLDASPLATLVQHGGKVAYANPAAVLTLGAQGVDDLVGCSWLRIIHPLSRDEQTACEEAVLRSGQGSQNPELRLARLDGSDVIVESSTVLVAFRGEPAIALFVADVTERRRMQGRILLADRMTSMGALAGGIAHELNNPLTYVIGNLLYVSDELADYVAELSSGERLETVAAEWGERLQEMRVAIGEAHSGAERVRRLVQDLKALATPDEERTSLVDVNQILETALNIARNEIRHRASLVRDQADVPAVRANVARLGQVFVNLILNAAEAIPEGSSLRNEIRVQTRSDDQGRVLVVIEDTGIGIEPDDLEQIFDPFFTTKPIGVGTGLGLTAARSVIKSLGGTIDVTSGRGEGTRVVVSLPGAGEPAPIGRLAGSSGVVARGRILLVDDEPMLCAIVQRVLERQHEVVAHTRPEEALSLIARGEPFDALLFDLMMPGINGQELYRRLADENPELISRLAFLTGGAFTPDAAAFVNRVAPPLLEKPFEPEELRAFVARVLQRAQNANPQGGRG